MKYIVFIVFSFFVTTAWAQEQEASSSDFGYWDLGLNFGGYFPSKYQAQFYNGSEDNVNKISYWFNDNGRYHYNEIYNLVNAQDTVFVRELPSNMRYTPAFQIGLYFRRTFDNYTGLSLQFDYSRLTATDKYTVEVDPDFIATEPDIRLYDIWGVEERVNIDILYSKFFKTKNPVLVPFFEGGLNITSTRVKEHKINIESQEYSLIDLTLTGATTPNLPTSQYDVQQGGMGLGFSLAAGIKLRFSPQVSVDPGLRVYFQKINLENYDLTKPAFSIFVRLSLADFFSSYE